ncbi:MAG: glycosyltransferase [Nisaea sp.]|uniref:glycosyltransferase n=1 Tax=Nisaea sp. TaxID=2024842 RepID=UPI001B07F174|nr:glycosyltransferase [Nisaea sp.]MBO6560736.1 glycosyltransferase [Nisaea sp.]
MAAKTTPKKKMKTSTAVVILGMHRSGTSALTRVCNILGVELSDNLLPPVEGNNETGFWEHLDTVVTDEQLLTDFEMFWDDPRALPAGWTGTEAAEKARRTILEFLEKDFAGAKLWGIKDPRMCRLMPLWEPVLEEFGAEPVYVIMQRNPLEVARSLHQRDGLSTGRGLVLWLRHVIESERATRGKRRAFLSYDGLMADWQGTIESMAKRLDLPLEKVSDESRAEIESFIRPGLRHFALHDTELYGSEMLSRWAGRVFAACRALESDPDDAAAIAAIDLVAAELELAGAYFDDIVGEAAPREKKQREEIVDLHRKVAERQNWATEQISRVAERDARLQERDRMIHSLMVQREDLHANYKQAQHDLNIENARIHRELRFITGTWSWKLTRPLRVINRLFLRTLGAMRVLKHDMHVASAIHAEALGGDVFRSTEPNPQLILGSPWRFLPEGWVEVSYEIEAKRGASPFLFADVGYGFEEAYRFRLPPTRGGTGKAIVRLPKGIFQLRFDPVHFVGTFEIKHIRIREVSRILLTLRTLWSRIREVVEHKDARKRVGKRLFDLVVKRDVKGFFEGVARLGPDPVSSYTRWFELYGTLTDDDRAAITKHIATMKKKPRFSIVMPTYNTPVQFLRKAIESVQNQLYPEWELCIADDASSSQETKDLLRRYANEDDRIKVTFREKNGHISAASNSALELATGDYIALLDHDDELTPHALYMMAVEVRDHPDADIIYSDEDKVDENGDHYAPYFKPDWAPDMFLGQNLINHLGVYRRKLVEKVGGFRLGYEGSQDYDLALRVIEQTKPENIRHIPHILYHWRAAEGSTALAEEEKDYTGSAAIRAIQDHLDRSKIKAKVVQGRDIYSQRVIYELPKKPPLVSLIIPTRNRADILKGAVDGIREKNDYPNWEIIIVDNGSDEEETLDYLAKLEKDERIRVHRDDGPFNYSRLNNDAARLAKGEIIGLINNDIAPINEDWLSEMVRQVTQPGVGAVGAKLYYENDTLQHGGVIVGLGGVAGHFDKRLPRDSRGYFGRAMLVQNFSAVTAACLLVPKKVFEEVGGLDEQNLAVAFNDVDFCLKIREAGHRIVWTPYAELYHYESISRGEDTDPDKRARFNAESEYMQKRWAKVCEHDPYYSPNLTLDFEQPSPADPPRALRPWNDYFELEDAAE